MANLQHLYSYHSAKQWLWEVKDTCRLWLRSFIESFLVCSLFVLPFFGSLLVTIHTSFHLDLFGFDCLIYISIVNDTVMCNDGQARHSFRIVSVIGISLFTITKWLGTSCLGARENKAGTSCLDHPRFNFPCRRRHSVTCSRLRTTYRCNGKNEDLRHHSIRRRWLSFPQVSLSRKYLASWVRCFRR